VRLVFLDGAQHCDRSLRGSPAIEVYERSAVHRPIENRIVTADALDVEYRSVHDL
jgi:hypothetical protein